MQTLWRMTYFIYIHCSLKCFLSLWVGASTWNVHLGSNSGLWNSKTVLLKIESECFLSFRHQLCSFFISTAHQDSLCSPSSLAAAGDKGSRLVDIFWKVILRKILRLFVSFVNFRVFVNLTTHQMTQCSPAVAMTTETDRNVDTTTNFCHTPWYLYALRSRCVFLTN